jgi:hypothetical protein
MRRYDRVADWQPETQSLHLGRHERLEQPCLHVGIDPAPAVGDGDLNGLVVAKRGRDRQCAIARLGVHHRLAGIGDQVQENLLQLNAVAPHCGQVRCESAGRRHAAHDKVAVRKFERVLDHAVQVERTKLRFALLQQISHPVDHVAGPLVGIHDIAEGAAQLCKVRRVARQKPLDRLGVAQDRRQRLIQFMGQGACKLAENADAREMRQLLALLLGIDLGPLPAGDVPVRQDRAPFRPTKRDDGELEPAQGVRR